MSNHHRINYVELPARHIDATKRFFQEVFGWSFVDYRPDYAAFNDGAFDGGFFRADLASETSSGSALVVLYSDDLERTRDAVEANGGAVVRPIFEFSGGQRFHFADPSGNEWAVWSE